MPAISWNLANSNDSFSTLLDSQIERKGFWGEITATYDWCEDNYEVTYYVAEFWNSVSNIFIIGPPCLAAINARTQGYELRYIITYISMVLVGLGSYLFHSTLLFPMQLFDEIPMILCSTMSAYCVFEVSTKGKRVNWILAACLTMFCLGYVVTYLIVRDHRIHVACFLFIFSLQMVWAIYKVTCEKIHNKQAVILGSVGLISSTLGGICWNVDRELCGNLKRLRSEQFSGRFFSPVTQLHAWWHLFSGFGILCLISSLLAIRLRVKRVNCRLKINRFGLSLVKHDDSSVLYSEHQSIPETQRRPADGPMRYQVELSTQYI